MTNLHPDNSLHTLQSRKRWLISAVCVTVCILAFGAGIFVTDFFAKKQEFKEATQTYPVIDSEEETFLEEVIEEKKPVEYVGDGEPLKINWINPFFQTSTAFDSTLYEALCFGKPMKEADLLQNNCGFTVPEVSAARLGIVVGGAYDGRYLVMATAAQPGMGSYYESFYLLEDPKGEAGPVLLDRHTRGYDGGFLSAGIATATARLEDDGSINVLTGFKIETKAVIPELDNFADEIFDKEGNRFLFTGYWARIDSIPASKMTYSLATKLSDGRDLYVRGSAESSLGQNQFFVIDEDGTILWYDMAVPFFNYERQAFDSDAYQVVDSVPAIVWNDGSINDIRYMKGYLGGCGYTNVTHVISEEEFAQLPAMIQAGRGIAKDGTETKIFEPSTYEDEYYSDTVFNVITFKTTDAEGNEIPSGNTYTQFVHPYVYFKDAFGRWIELMNQEIVPPVECGKPVIYLYPEEEMDLSVWVDPKGGFSFTEPEYGDGWEVTAYPDGRIVNREDSKEYPYLFWEGRGGSYAAPEFYWVIERSQVELFLKETLSQMGLIQKEINDFLEFWLPRMQTSPYYKIGFHDTRVMNELAPLSLSVKPDTVFRILMDYSPLDKSEPSHSPLRIPRVLREGFTVIEWGGVIR